MEYKLIMLKRLKTKKFWLTIARDGILFLSMLYLVELYQTRNTPDMAPELDAHLISGESVELGKMLKKSPVLIYFWGSWCPICSFTSPGITEIAKEHQVISIAFSSGSLSQLIKYLQENKYQFPVINDPDGVISQKWGVYVAPSFFIINRKGEISSVTNGLSSVWGLKLRLWLAS